MHVRKVVRDAALAKLTGATAAGARVYANWTIAPAVEHCPFIVVETAQSSVAPATLCSEQLRTIALDVSLFVATADSAADAIDALAVQVEGALAAGLEVGESDCEFAGDMLDQERFSPAEVAALRMRYVVRIVTDGPETILS